MIIPIKATPPTIIPAIAPRLRLGAEGESPDGAAVIQMAREVLEDVELVVVVLVVSKNLAVEVRARNVDPVVVLFLSLVGVESSGSGGTLCRPESWRENGKREDGRDVLERLGIEKSHHITRCSPDKSV